MGSPGVWLGRARAAGGLWERALLAGVSGVGGLACSWGLRVSWAAGYRRTAR